jgi:hypothetical protein
MTLFGRWRLGEWAKNAGNSVSNYRAVDDLDVEIFAHQREKFLPRHILDALMEFFLAFECFLLQIEVGKLTMTMYKLFSKIFILALLTISSSLQGWPLLVAKTCNMAAPQMMSQGGDCCCCKNSPNSPSPAFAACNPGKSLVGILATDSSVLPGKDKTGHFFLHNLAAAPVADLLSPSVSSSLPGPGAGELILPHTSATPLFLFACTFRI